MSGVEREEYVDCRHDLLTALTVAQDRRDRGRANEDKLRTFETQIEKLNIEIGDLTECANHLKDVYQNIAEYERGHREKVQNILDLAIQEAGNLVPDADVAGIHLDRRPDGKVYVVNSLGQDINLREGGGYRAVLGALLRYACLKAQPDALQVLLFDEYFFTLSDTTTNAIKPIFEAMKKDVTLLCIEQRRNAMDGILDAEYTVKKGEDKNTVVEKTL